MSTSAAASVRFSRRANAFYLHHRLSSKTFGRKATIAQKACKQLNSAKPISAAGAIRAASSLNDRIPRASFPAFDLAALLLAASAGLLLYRHQHPPWKDNDGDENARSSVSSSLSTLLLPARQIIAGSTITTTQTEPRRITTLPTRNVMINRMRSVAGRGLNEKYKVDWGTVLGEGAYGSVHPARLALTGEKVRKLDRNTMGSDDR